MLNSVIGRLRLIGMIEGVSFLLLLGIAMPLKYLADMPTAVLVVGSIHGGLFLLYLVALAHAKYVRNWSIAKWFPPLVASVLPFGPFVVDGRLRREEGATAESEPRA